MYARDDPEKRREYNRRYYERNRELLLAQAAANRARQRREHREWLAEQLRDWAAAWGHRPYPEPGGVPYCWDPPDCRLEPGYAVTCTGDRCRCPFCRPELWPGFEMPPGGDFTATPELEELWDMLTGKVAPVAEVLQAARSGL